MSWPDSAEALAREQAALARRRPRPWRAPDEPYAIGACFTCFPRRHPGPGARGDPAWAGAAWTCPGEESLSVVVSGVAGAPYRAGLLALREGPLLEAALRLLPRPPDVLLVNATGRDHPHAAGLALHLGATLDLPTVGVTHRPLLATGRWPEPARGAHAPLSLEGREVACWLRTRTGARPLVVHPAWRIDAGTARAVVLAASSESARTPEPMRLARRAARRARAADPQRA